MKKTNYHCSVEEAQISLAQIVEKMEPIFPGTRVLVGDQRLYKNDKDTPLSVTQKPATIVCRYGYISERFGNYPDCVDVLFDHRPEISKGHFTYGIKKLEN